MFQNLRQLFVCSFLCLLTAFIIPVFGQQQEPQLANQYYNSGEYAKAADLYLKLYEKQGRNDYYFDRYLNSLIAMRDYKNCEKAIKKQLRKVPEAVRLYVTYGALLELEFKPEEAESQYQMAVLKLPADRNRISRLGNSFVSRAKYDFAIQTYEKGSKLLKSDFLFSYNLGDLYRRQGDQSNMIKHYLQSLIEMPGRLNSLKTTFQRYLKDEDYPIVQEHLYELIQQYPDNLSFVEMLEWVFIQSHDYKRALRQAKALNARLEENGNRVFNIGQIAMNDRDYDSAIIAFEYIIQNHALNSPYYFDAKKEMLAAKRKRITRQVSYSKEDLLVIEKEYEDFIREIGKNNQTALLIQQLAEFEALYLNNEEKAIELLEELVQMVGINKFIIANSKLDLGDYYLINGDIWEATLLYSQVDKAFKEEYLGEQARYRNAMLAYYAGDFEWSQAQFDILKSSTSKMISNDAIDRSVFIMDNLGLDTTEIPMQIFSEAELLLYQNKIPEAINKLDSLSTEFPEHGLKDDIMFVKAQLFQKQKDYEKAIALYEQIIEEHPEEIKTDNSIFEMAQLYETVLEDKEKAMELYQRLFLEFSNSTLAVEARKKFRLLRGDDLQ